MEVRILIFPLINSINSNEQVYFQVFKHYGNFSSKIPMRIQNSHLSRNLIMLHDSKQVRIFDFIENINNVYISMIDSNSIEARQSTFYKVSDTNQVITTAYLLVILFINHNIY